MDDGLRNSLWNLILTYLPVGGLTDWPQAAHLLAKHLYKEPIDRVPSNANAAYNWVRSRFLRRRMA